MRQWIQNKLLKGESLKDFPIRSKIRQRWQLSPFLFIIIVLEIKPEKSGYLSIYLCVYVYMCVCVCVCVCVSPNWEGRSKNGFVCR